MNSLTIALAVALFGALLIYAAWTKRSVRSLLLGDNSQASGGYA